MQYFRDVDRAVKAFSVDLANHKAAMLWEGSIVKFVDVSVWIVLFM